MTEWLTHVKNVNTRGPRLHPWSSVINIIILCWCHFRIARGPRLGTPSLSPPPLTNTVPLPPPERGTRLNTGLNRSIVSRKAYCLQTAFKSNYNVLRDVLPQVRDVEKKRLLETEMFETDTIHAWNFVTSCGVLSTAVIGRTTIDRLCRSSSLSHHYHSLHGQWWVVTHCHHA